MDKAFSGAIHNSFNVKKIVFMKLLLIDRDGTLIEEPKPDLQVDSLEKLRFIPGAIYALARLVRETDYQLVLVTNQDGLGTPAFPEHTFWPAQQHMMDTLAGAGIHFRSVHIDRSFEHEQLPTRKPGTALLQEYLEGAVDWAGSCVIGDRLTDVQLAQNLGCRAVLLRNEPLPADTTLRPDLVTNDWEQIYRFLRLPARQVQHRRETRETRIEVRLNLDGSGQSDIRTGLGFFDHMLDQVARHGGLDLWLRTEGDLHIDEHHTIEDTALALGEAFHLALSDKRGLARYGFCLPMDDALAQAAIDFGGRPWLVWEAGFQREKIGDMPTEMFYHFFKSFADTAKCNLNIRVEGQNEHHKIEAIFKAFAKAIKMALRRNPSDQRLPSTKEVI
jgi:imidazoleglycerol-phosphate dehydratase / histidinol-phosphatase